MLNVLRIPLCRRSLYKLHFQYQQPRTYSSSQTTQPTTMPQPTNSDTNNNNNNKQPLKILMLHGYTQSGPTFHAKTRALIKHLQKSLPLHTLHPVYPTGPLRLELSDIPGYQPPPDDDNPPSVSEPPLELEAYGWWRRSDTSDPPEYVGIEDGIAAVAEAFQVQGPFDGIIGFSQGAAMAAMVASLLEEGRKEAFGRFGDPKVASESESGSGSVAGIPFPESFKKENLGDRARPLKFVISYSGFRAPGPRYRAFYEDPAIRTPVLHVLGSLDSVVDDGRSRALIEACEGDPEKEGRVIWHPGGHFLPSQRPFLDAAAKFIREQLESGTGGTSAAIPKKEEVEEDVNDMDLPF